MREINRSQRIYRLQAHLLKRKRVQKWIRKRVYYNKKEKILQKDIKIFQNSLYIKSYINRVRNLEKNVSKAITDPIKEKKQKIFQKLTDIDLIIKIRRIITRLKEKYLQKYLKKKIRLSSNSILDWLMNYFKNQKEMQFLKETSKQEKKEVYYVICKLSKEKQVQKDKKYESAELWYKKFIEQCRPFINLQIHPQNINMFDTIQIQRQQYKNIIQENQIELFSKNSQVPQVNQKLKQLPTRGNVIKNMIEKVENEFQQIKNQKIGKKSHQSQQSKILKIKKPLCPLPLCKKQLTVRKCPNFNHLLTICQQCQWNQHACQQIQPLNCQVQGQIDIIAKGERIKNFKIKRLRKSESENNLMQTLGKLNYKYTTKMNILPGTPSKIICYYPVLGQNAWNQIIKNRQQECFLPLSIKQSSVKDAGLGVFATVDIRQVGTLICSYLGEMGIGSKTPILRSSESSEIINDSIFTLGWIQRQLFLAAPNLYTNIGRFINYNEPKKCNLKPSLCLLQTGQKKYEISVFLTTIRQISKGQELFYNYGNEYPFQKQ